MRASAAVDADPVQLPGEQRAALAKLRATIRSAPWGKGTVQFQPDAPLPAGPVRRIVRARVAQTRERTGARTAAPPAAQRRRGPAAGKGPRGRGASRVRA